MYVCLCKGITDTQIRRELDNGARSLKDIRKSLGAMTQCGKCACLTRELVQDYQAQLQSLGSPLWAVA